MAEPSLNRKGETAPRPIFAIFEGGGAKGVAHVGALQAIEENRLEIIGVAGTSAGALIAVMAAIGFYANDIMSPSDSKANLLSLMDQTPISLLGEEDWKSFQRLIKHSRSTLYSAMIGGVVGSYLFAPRVSETLRRIFTGLGHFSTDNIRGFIGQVIRDRLVAIKSEANIKWDVPENITFKVLAQGWPTVVPLKIVATDVDNGTLEIFDAQRTPDVVVAEAVAASISIPLVFKPASIPSYRPGRFSDGGLVSNLPIWGFSEEKLGYEREHFTCPPVPVIGFSLRARPSETGVTKDFLSYANRIVDAALQGSQGSALAFLDDVSIISLEVPLGMLDFGSNWQVYSDARKAGYQSANNQLRFSLDVKPDRIRRELETTRNATLVMLNRLRIDRRKAQVSQLRINLIRPVGRKSLRVMESLNMDADADDRLLLDLRGRGAAEAFREKGLRVFRLGRRYEDRNREFMTKYERALVRTSVRSVVCVPIFKDVTAWNLDEGKRPVPSGILAIDSDEALAPEFQNPKLMKMLVAQSAILYEAVSAESDHGQERQDSNISEGDPQVSPKKRR